MLFVLDLDDTLYLERDYVRSGFIAIDRWISQHLGFDQFFENAWGQFEAGITHNIFDLVLKQFNLYNPDLVRNLARIYRCHPPDISLLSDSKDFLERHRSDSLALVSDGNSEAQWLKIRALEVEKYFSKIIVTDDRGKAFWKPHPWSFLSVQGNKPPESCTYIGDNPLKDFDAPLKLGWSPSIRLRRKGSLHFLLPTPDHCIELKSLEEIRLDTREDVGKE
jgi:putative hydrolase of the HAD superfamily